MIYFNAYLIYFIYNKYALVKKLEFFSETRVFPLKPLTLGIVSQYGIFIY